MNTPTSQPAGTNGSEAPALAQKQIQIAQAYARLRDKTSAEISRLEKKKKRACFLAGEMVLADPAVWESVSAKLEARLSAIGPAARVIEEYPTVVAQIATLKGFLGHTHGT
jgi:hypothetical protein